MQPPRVQISALFFSITVKETPNDLLFASLIVCNGSVDAAGSETEITVFHHFDISLKTKRTMVCNSISRFASHSAALV